MNTNDLPPAARLAVLIEAGRAANPHVRHGRLMPFCNGNACAMGFAAMGAGKKYGFTYSSLECMSVAGVSFSLGAAVIGKNDGGATLDEICRALREGELAKAPA